MQIYNEITLADAYQRSKAASKQISYGQRKRAYPIYHIIETFRSLRVFYTRTEEREYLDRKMCEALRATTGAKQNRIYKEALIQLRKRQLQKRQ